ncbi:MAG: ABC transporter permease [Peptococcaceae bacterium]|nr:ABC transporter permease [Peptococcaceae bacterium]
MTRLMSVIRHDFRLQKRYGLYYAGAFVAAVWILLIRQMPPGILDIAVPLVVFTDLGIVGFYFIAGMILFEKGENTLSAVVVTPLRFAEYLASKLVTLTVLALVVTLAVVVVSYGPGFDMFRLIPGVVLASLTALLVSFIAVSPFESISSYILPSQLYLLVMNLPLLHYFGYWKSPLFYLIPTHASLLLIRSAFSPVETWELIYSVIYQVIWVGILSWLARRAFDRHIVAERRGG